MDHTIVPPRLDLNKALAAEGLHLGPDLRSNLGIGRQLIVSALRNIGRSWLDTLSDRSKRGNPDDLVPLMYATYYYHSTLINGGEKSAPTIMETTFTSAGEELWDWLLEYPDLSRTQLESITTSVIEEGVNQASQLTVHSVAKEQLLREITDRGELAYVFDPIHQKVVFNPEYEGQIKQRETELAGSGDFFDQTNILLKCPALAVRSQLYANSGSMLHDFIRFKSSVYAEIYLATQGRT